jgi:hypothetical protein
MSAVETPLRILIVVNLPWDVRLGAIRVWAELAQEWRAAGVVVEHYSLTEAFPKPVTSRVGYALREITFAFKAAAFVRKNAARFEVIDALIGALPFSKAESCAFAACSWRVLSAFISSTRGSNGRCRRAGRRTRKARSPGAWSMAPSAAL